MVAIIDSNNGKVLGLANLDIIKKPYFKDTDRFSYSIGNLDVQIGDVFENGTFLRNGKPVGEYVPSYELKQAMDSIESSLLDNAEILLEMQYELDKKGLGGTI